MGMRTSTVSLFPRSSSLIPSLRAWLLRPSVRAKIMGIVLGLVLLLGFGIIWQVRISMTAALTARLHERGVSIARDLAARSADLILINNTYALHELVQDTLSNNSDLRYVFLLDANGRVLVHSFANGIPRNLLEQNQVAPTERAHAVEFTTDEGIIHDIAVPIFEGRAGTARIGLDEKSVQRAVNDLTLQMLLTTLVVSLLGIGAAYVFTLVLTRPIRTLVNATQAVAQGDLAQRAPEWGDDELGKLSRAFNQMVGDLAIGQAAMRQRHRELTALNAVANAVNAPAPLDTMLERALRAVLDALALKGGWVFLFDRSGSEIQLTSWIGLPQELAAQEVSTALRGCPCTTAIREHHAHIVVPLPFNCPLRHARLQNARAVVSHVTVPILARGRVLGVFGVVSDEADTFQADEVHLLEAIGQQLGSAVENARLWDDLRDKERVRGQLLDKVITAQEQERKRIARELHDDTGQAITSLMVGLRAVSDTCEPATRPQLAALREIAAQALDAVKRLARELRPPLLDDLGLAAALERYVTTYRHTHGLNVDLELTGFRGDERLAPEIELTVYRIVQEALTNVAKHAHAKNVSIVVERKPSALIAIVEDDGNGFDLRAVVEGRQEGRLGLAGMRERAELVGGRVQFESAQGKGSSVFVELPIQEQLYESANSIGG
jgi:signal transduction histidine kinase